MSKYKELAAERYRKLWNYYNENDGKLFLADCYQLLGTKNVRYIFETFETYKLGDPPPIWDRAAVRYKRYADALNVEAKRLNTKMLTMDEMAAALDMDRSNIPYALSQCREYGYDTPAIKQLCGWRVRKEMEEKKIEEKLKNMDDDGLEFQNEYAEGLPVLSRRVNPENEKQIIYILK